MQMNIRRKPNIEAERCIQYLIELHVSS